MGPQETPRAPLRQPLDGHSAARGSPYGLPAQVAAGGQFWTPIEGQYSTPIDRVEKAKQFLASGKGVRQVAKMAGISPASVSRIKASMTGDVTRL